MIVTTFGGRLINDVNGISVQVTGAIDFDIDPESGLVKALTGMLELPYAGLRTDDGQILRISDLTEDTKIDLNSPAGPALGTRERPLSLHGYRFKLEVRNVQGEAEITVPFTVGVDIEVVCVQPGEWVMIRWHSHEPIS